LPKNQSLFNYSRASKQANTFQTQREIRPKSAGNRIRLKNQPDILNLSQKTNKASPKKSAEIKNSR
jgi:hypothetical protein